MENIALSLGQKVDVGAGPKSRNGNSTFKAAAEANRRRDWTNPCDGNGCHWRDSSGDCLEFERYHVLKQVKSSRGWGITEVTTPWVSTLQQTKSLQSLSKIYMALGRPIESAVHTSVTASMTLKLPPANGSTVNAASRQPRSSPLG